jgi:hypothetical protein
MTEWTVDELDKIGKAEELDFSSLRRAGTLRKTVTIWVVRIGDGLYVRAYKGRKSPWFRGVVECHAGLIESGGVHKNVTFIEEQDAEINARIDAAFRTKYAQQPAEYVDPMVTSKARAATLKLMPR